MKNVKFVRQIFIIFSNTKFDCAISLLMHSYSSQISIGIIHGYCPALNFRHMKHRFYAVEFRLVTIIDRVGCANRYVF